MSTSATKKVSGGIGFEFSLISYRNDQDTWIAQEIKSSTKRLLNALVNKRTSKRQNLYNLWYEN